MARIVYVPELGRSFSFRDGATDQEVDSFFKGAFPTPPSAGVIPDIAPSSTPTGPDESGVLGRFAYGLGTGITDIPGGIASLFYPAEEAAQTSAGQFSEEARKYLEETLGIDPTKDPTAAQQAAQALGSVASFLIPGGAVAKGAGLAGKTAATAGRLGTVTAGAQGVALGAEARSERIRQQLASGMQISEEQQLASQRMSGLIGAAEAYPLAKFFGPLQQLLSKVPLSQAPALNKIVQSRLGRITRAGLEEGAQEAASGIANDIMELGIYNPDVQIGQDILSNAGTGAFAGSFVEGIIQLAAGRKLRPYKQLQEDLDQESRQSIERVRLGQIAQAAEDLRQSGVQGEVNIEEDEFDGLPVFNIKSPDGKIITQFNDRGGRAEDSAIAAVNLYSKNTGIKIKPNVIKKTPEVSAEADEEFVDDPDVEVKEPPVPPGMTRVYHSGSRGEGETGRFVSTSKQYASDYRKDLPLFYTDLPADDPRVSPDEFNPEQTVDQGFTFNFDLQPEEAVTLRRVKRDEKEVPEAIPETAPIGAVEQPAEGISTLEDIIQQPSTQQVNEAGEPVSPVEPTVAVPPEGKPVADVITPRSLREAYMKGPKIAVPTREVADRFQKIYESLINRLGAIAPSDVTVGLRDFIETENPDVLIKGMHRVDKSGGQTKNIIDLATGIYGPDMTVDEMVNNLLDVLNHEVIHAIRRNGLIRPAEWKILSRAVTEAKMPGKKYTYLDKAQAVYKPSLDPVYANPDAVIEEAVAELYKDWVRNGKKPVKGFGQTQGLLNRITEFFRRIFRVLRDNNYDEVFKAIESGEVRGRPLDPSSRAGVRLSAGVIDERRDGRDGEGSYAGGKLAPLDGAPKGAGQLGPDPSLVAVAERYAAQNGINLKRQGEYVQVNEELARSIADAYDKMPHAPQDPAVKEAYADLIRQTKAQYDALIDDGYVFTFFDSNSDPYGGNPWNAMRDLRANKRMAVYGTYDGYGTEGITGAAVDDNPMLADTGLKWPDQSGVLRPVTANDLFRAVHDAFGHGLEGAGFRARGEENAWQAHVRLFTGPAVGAITSETRGQNSWLNFGPYGEKNLKALLEDTVFAEQKTGLMPSWTWEEGRARDFEQETRFSAAPALNSEEFKRWFKDSKAVNPDGTPKVFYHGTPFSFKEFGKGRSASISGEEGPFFFSPSAKFANQYATSRLHAGGHGADIKSGGRMVPVYLSVQKPFDYESIPDVKALVRELKKGYEEGRYTFGEVMDFEGEELAVFESLIKSKVVNPREDLVTDRLDDIMGKVLSGNWPNIETKGVQKAIRNLGYDGFYITESGFKNLAVYRPEQVKSIFNQFEEGAAESKRFSAAPLSPYLQSQNQQLFTEPPRLSFVEKIFDYLFGYTPASKERMRVAVRANIVDKTAFVTYLEKQLNLRDNNVFDRYVADYSATAALTQRRRASHLTSSTIMMGNPKINFADPGNIMSATIKVEESPDSILKIAEILTTQGPIDPATGNPQDLSDVFKTYATAIRGRDLRAKGLQVPRYITPQYVNEALTTIPRDYPQVVEAYNMYQRYNKRLMEAARDSGLFSDAEFARLTRDANYYSFYRELYQEELAPTATTKTAGEFKFREYKGSEEGGLINDPLYVMIRNSQFLIESMAKNLATTKSFDVSRRMGEAQLLARGQDPDISQGFQKDVMYFKDKGVLKRFAVKDPLLVTALGSDDRVVLGKAFDLLGLPADLLRETVTRDPAFMVANLLRDTVSSWITSGEDIKPFIGTAKGLVSALKQSSSLKDLMGRGVVGSYDMAMMEPTDIANTLRRRTIPKNIHMVTSVNGAVGGLKALWDVLGQASEASDAATRIAVYDAARAQGLSEAEAALRAVEIMDFSRRGASTLLNILTKTVPFLNARIQGLDVLYQSIVAGKRFVMGQSLGERDANLGKKFLVRGAMLAAISIALEMYNNDDEDYEQLDSYIKDSNLLIPLKLFGFPGEFIAIPKPFEAGLIFSTFPQMLYKYFVSGDASNRDAANLFFSQFASTFGINPLPQILIPPLEVIMNHDFYTGLPLISEGKMRLDPSLQYDSRTSTIARMINNIPFIYDVNTGEFRGPSPIAVDNIISGYSGPIGSYIVMGVGAIMNWFNAGPEKIPTEISQYPVIRRFFVDAEAKNPAVVTQAYELFRLVDEANRTFSRLRQANDAEALMDYFEQKKDVLAYKKHIFKLVDRLNKLSAYERQIERDKTMTDEEKLAAKRRLREMRIRVAATVEEINKKLGR